MVSRQESKKRQLRYEKAIARYHKERQRNLLAKPGAHEFILILDHLKAGFNAPKIFRSAQAFGAREIHLINVPPFDPSPAKGAFRKVPARFHDSFAECYKQLQEQGYTFFKLEAQCKQAPYQQELPAKSAFILGHEEIGFSFTSSDYPDIQCIGIPHSGVMESLNVSIAASIVMYEYIKQMAIPIKK